MSEDEYDMLTIANNIHKLLNNTYLVAIIGIKQKVIWQKRYKVYLEKTGS